MNPSKPVEIFEYSKTTKSFKNRATSIVIELLVSVESGSYIHNEPYVQFIKNTIKNLCNILALPYDNRNCYDVDNIKEILDGSQDMNYLNVVDCCFQSCYGFCPNHSTSNVFQLYRSFRADLNYVLRSEGIGYEIIEDKFIPIYDKIIQDEIIRPVFEILNHEPLKDTGIQLIEAFDKFKGLDNSGAIVSASKAFENAVSIICKKLGWIPKDNTTSKLIECLRENEFFPNYMQDPLNSLAKILSSQGIIRNSNGAHSSAEALVANDDYVKYAINQAATNILFLVQIYNRRKSEIKS